MQIIVMTKDLNDVILKGDLCVTITMITDYQVGDKTSEDLEALCWEYCTLENFNHA